MEFLTNAVGAMAFASEVIYARKSHAECSRFEL